MADVAISTTSVFGPSVVVGAPYDYNGAYGTGCVYTYRLSGGAWGYQQQLLPNPLDLSDGNGFGYAVAVDGDYCVAGAPYQFNPTGSLDQAGAAYVFVYGGGQWFTQQKLQGNLASAQMGYSLSLNNDLLAVGAPYAAVATDFSPAIRIYQRSGATWTQQPPVYLAAYQFSGDKHYFGASMAIENDVLIVSMSNARLTPLNNTSTSTKGFVLVFKKYALLGYYAVWKLINDDDPFGAPAGSNYFGNTVSMKNGSYIIGIPGKTVGNKIGVGTVAFGYLQ